MVKLVIEIRFLVNGRLCRQPVNAGFETFEVELLSDRDGDKEALFLGAYSENVRRESEGP